MNRRQLLIGCSASVLAAGIEPSRLLAGPPEGAGGALSRATFEPLVRTRFRLIDREGRTRETLTLEAVDDGPTSPGVEQFALRFRGSDREPLGPDVYTLAHRERGTLALYLEPSGDRPQGVYRAGFALLK
jgi:hypothetical protein